jgi:hypothetical protein
MAGWNEAFPYVINYPPRDEVVSWCDHTFGAGEWQYFNSEFRFQSTDHVAVFTLKWL